MDPARRYFLVERFVPSLPESGVAAAAARLAVPGDGAAIHLGTALVPSEETCLSLFLATDALAVATVNARADFPLHRIVEVRLIPPLAVRVLARGRPWRESALSAPEAGPSESDL